MCSVPAVSDDALCMHTSMNFLLAAQGPSSVNLPITDLTTNQTVGNVTTVFRSALTICVTDPLAPGTSFILVTTGRDDLHLSGLLPASSSAVPSQCVCVCLQAMLACAAPLALMAAAATQQ